MEPYFNFSSDPLAAVSEIIISGATSGTIRN